LGLVACSKSPAPTPVSQPAPRPAASPQPPGVSNADLGPLFSHIWRVNKAPSPPPLGNIFIFLANGTLLETSCTETYRIATWTIDKTSPRELQVVEDRELAFTANIKELTDSTLSLQKHLVRSKETQDETLTAVEGEFVCPDLPK
jgi:hypothetical protein